MGRVVVLVLRHVRIRVLIRVQVAQRVVHLAVLGLVCTHVQDQVGHRVVTLRHVPVLDSDLGCRHRLPLGQLAGFDLLDGPCVSDDGLFLEVADEAVAGAWRDEVREEEAVEEDTLGAEDHETHEPAGFGQLHE